jgi:hypothetical protein
MTQRRQVLEVLQQFVSSRGDHPGANERHRRAICAIRGSFRLAQSSLGLHNR